MGIDLEIWINREDLLRMIEYESNWIEKLSTLWNLICMRWYYFLEYLEVDYTTRILSSRDILLLLYEKSKRVELDDILFRICSKYDLLFTMDTIDSIEGDYVPVSKVYLVLEEVGSKSIRELLSTK